MSNIEKRLDNLIPFTGGYDPRRHKKQKGERLFETDFNEAVDEIAKAEGITRSQARKELLKVAYYSAKEGNYNFWEHIHNRLYGKIPEAVKLFGDEDRPISILANVRQDNSHNQNRENAEENPGDPRWNGSRKNDSDNTILN